MTRLYHVRQFLRLSGQRTPGYATFFASILLAWAAGAAADDHNVEVTGKLVTEPCALSTKSATIDLDWGNFVGKYFYQDASPRTPGMPFVIELIDCDISLGTEASVTFIGSESITMPGMLLPTDGEARGLVFGIETPKAGSNEMTPVLINTASPFFTLSHGTTELKFNGYIEAQPDAIKNKTIQLGPFMGTATFQINYP